MPHRRALVGEDALGVLSPLSSDHRDRCRIERHGDGLARLRLIGMNPRHLAIEIALLPGEPGFVGRTKPCRQGERRHVSEMRRQLLEQRRRLVVGEKADPPRGLLQEPHRGRPIQRAG